MGMTSIGRLGSPTAGLAVELVDDDDAILIDDDGSALFDENNFFGQTLYLKDDDNSLLIDDDGAQITDMPPRSTPVVTQWLQGVGANLTLEDGTPFRLRGINWSGFESRMFPGLLTARAYKSVVINGKVERGIIDQLAAVGFNAIRFPICEDMTWDNAVCQSYDGVSVALNPDLINYDNLVEGTVNANGTALLTPMEILDKFVAHAKSLGVRVILDMHCAAPNTVNDIGFNGRWYTSTGPDGAAGTMFGLVNDPRNEQNLIDAWVTLGTRYKDEPAMCGFDLVNEPWSTTWDDDPVTGLPAAYERIGNAIQAVNPNVLIICEGNLADNNNLPVYPSGYVTWPVYAENLWGARTRPIQLTVRQDKVCYAPHEYYGDGYDWTKSYSFPYSMVEVWDTLWGWLITEDVAPVIITEWGGNFSGNIPAQMKWVYQLMKYMYQNMEGKVNWFHWAMVPGTSIDDASQSVVGLIMQLDGSGGNDDSLWPAQEKIVRQFISASQDA